MEDLMVTLVDVYKAFASGDYVHAIESYSAGNNATDPTSTGSKTRDLNTFVYNGLNATFSSGYVVITEPGKYMVIRKCVNYNALNSIMLNTGEEPDSSLSLYNTPHANTIHELTEIFTKPIEDAGNDTLIRIINYIGSIVNTDEFGLPMNNVQNEIFSEMIIIRLRSA
jgi:hypothetical protein